LFTKKAELRRKEQYTGVRKLAQIAQNSCLAYENSRSVHNHHICGLLMDCWRLWNWQLEFNHIGIWARVGYQWALVQLIKQVIINLRDGKVLK